MNCQNIVPILNIALWGLFSSGCGGQAPVATSQARQAADSTAQKAISAFWSEQAKTEIRASFQQLKGNWPKAVGNRFLIRMEQLTTEWVERRTLACERSSDRSEEAGFCDEAVQTCFEFTLHKQEALVDIAKDIELYQISKLDWALDGIWIEVVGCTKSAVFQSPIPAVNDDVSQAARHYLAKAQLYAMMGDKRFESSLNKAVSFAEKGASPDVKVKVGLSQSENLLLLGKTDEAIAGIQRAKALAEKHNLKISMANIDMVKGNRWFIEKNFERARVPTSIHWPGWNRCLERQTWHSLHYIAPSVAFILYRETRRKPSTCT